MAHRRAAFVGTRERIDEKGRVRDDQIERFRRRELLHGAAFESHPAAPRRGVGILAGLRNVVDVYPRNRCLRGALGQHQGDQPRAGADVEHPPVGGSHTGPGPQQNAVGADLHRTAVLANRELFEAENNS